MSGMPNINPLDADKFRQNYLANLALQANIDDKNLQANKIFIKTGSTPTQPTDQRTTAEIYADLERLKIQVRSKLGEITDGTNADDIVQQLTPDQLRFLAQNADIILKEIKSKHQIGITAAVFIPILDRYIDKYQQTLGVEFGLQQATGQQILLSNQQILHNMITTGDLRPLQDRLRHIIGQGNTNRGLAQQVLADTQRLVNIIPDAATLQGIMAIPNAQLRADIEQDLNNALLNLPSRNELRARINAIIDLNAANTADMRRDLERIQGMVQVPADSIAAIRDAEHRILSAVGDQTTSINTSLERVGGQVQSAIRALQESHTTSLTGLVDRFQALQVRFGHDNEAALEAIQEAERSILRQLAAHKEHTPSREELSNVLIGLERTHTMRAETVLERLEILQNIFQRDQSAVHAIQLAEERIIQAMQEQRRGTETPTVVRGNRYSSTPFSNTTTPIFFVRSDYDPNETADPDQIYSLLGKPPHPPTSPRPPSQRKAGGAKSLQADEDSDDDYDKVLDPGHLTNNYKSRPGYKSIDSYGLFQHLHLQDKKDFLKANTHFFKDRIQNIHSGRKINVSDLTISGANPETRIENTNISALVEEFFHILAQPQYLRVPKRSQSSDRVASAVETARHQAAITRGELAASGAKADGKGLTSSRRKIHGGSLKVNPNFGVEEIKFVPFGRYVLNKHQLHQNKIALRTPYNKAIPNFPAKLVSEDLAKVLQTILGKGVPSFDDLDKLTDEEKHYLHQIANVSHVLDRLTIPTPDKSEEQKEINRFMILKGEIMSGNDSQELVKEFKLLIMRLNSKGLLPKKQTTDLLCELASLGF